MNENEYIIKFSNTICTLRKKFGMTQESLAEKLGVRFQVISEWENEQSYPAIKLLPQIADVFDVRIDELFGRSNATELSENVYVNELPWEDNETIVMAVFKGHKLLENESDVKGFHFKCDGDLQNVDCRCSLECGVVKGNASAGDSIKCDTIGGNANAYDCIICDTIRGGASAYDYIKCDKIGGNANACDYTKCDNININNNTNEGGNVDCVTVVE